MVPAAQVRRRGSVGQLAQAAMGQAPRRRAAPSQLVVRRLVAQWVMAEPMRLAPPSPPGPVAVAAPREARPAPVSRPIEPAGPQTGLPTPAGSQCCSRVWAPNSPAFAAAAAGPRPGSAAKPARTVVPAR